MTHTRVDAITPSTSPYLWLKQSSTRVVNKALNTVSYCLGQNKRPFPMLPHHPGLTTPDLFLSPDSFNSTEFAKHISLACKLGLEEKSRKCSIYLGQVRGIVICDPKDLHDTWVTNEKNLNSEESTPIFGHYFGKNVIMAKPTGVEWRGLRNMFTSRLFEKPAMFKNTITIHTILNDYIKKLQDSKATSFNLEELANNFTLDMILKGLLHAEKISDEVKKKLSHLIANGVDSAVKLNQVAWLAVESITEPYTGKIFLEADSITEEAEKIIKHQIIGENKKTMSETDNWLNLKIKMEKDKTGKTLDIDANELIKEATFLLTAGHDTTAKHFMFTFMLVTQHPAVLNKIIAEIKSLKKPPQEWDEDDIRALTYLDCVSLESLRLCPPLPIQKVKISKDFMTHDGVALKKGDHIFTHIGETHRLPDIYPNPDQFIPERFTDQKPEQFISQTLDKNNPFYFAWMPFGTGARSCPGRRLAVQEVKIAIAYFAYFFGMTMEHTWKLDQVKTTFGLRPDMKEPMQLKIVPRMG